MPLQLVPVFATRAGATIITRKNPALLLVCVVVAHPDHSPLLFLTFTDPIRLLFRFFVRCCCSSALLLFILMITHPSL